MNDENQSRFIPYLVDFKILPYQMDPKEKSALRL